jgi:hypothetical protein
MLTTARKRGGGERVRGLLNLSQGHRDRLALGAALFAAALSTAAGAATTAGAGELPPDGDYGAAAAGCTVTEPQVVDTPFPGGPAPGWIAQNGLYVSFGDLSTVAVPPRDRPPWPYGTTIANAGRGGRIGAKIPWWRDPPAWGRLRVRGWHWLSGERLRSRYSNHLGRKSEVVPGGMIFSREGCWTIKARSGSATLEAVIWVVNLARG